MSNSQGREILEHLKKCGSITGAEAYEKYRCYRLSSVIFRLREHHNIETIMCESTDEYNKKSHYGKYIYLCDKNAKSENNG